MTQDNDEDEEHRELLKRFDENSRPWQTYWFWRDRPLAEREAAVAVLTGAGLHIEALRSREIGETRLTVRLSWTEHTAGSR